MTVDFNDTIRELRADLALIDLAIEHLSKLRDLPTNYEVMRPFKRRAGRKSMGKKERREVSRRMRNYWEGRRQQKSAAARAAVSV